MSSKKFKRRSFKKWKLGTKAENDFSFKYNTHITESHGAKILGVSFCGHLKPEEPIVFATCASNFITVYECDNKFGIKLLQCYADPKDDELYHTCCWSFDPATLKPIIAAGGNLGIIRIISPMSKFSWKNCVGHGNAINDLKFHPKYPDIVMSASKDLSVRLWNITTDVQIVIFGGIEGHRAEVLSADFDAIGSRIISCGLDRSLKIWHLDESPVKEAIVASFSFNRSKSINSFKTVLENYPVFSTTDVHRNYVDCAKWLGDLILSKSSDSSIVCWKPRRLDDDDDKEICINSSPTFISDFKYLNGEFFFIRFSMDLSKYYMSVGNGYGIIFIWKLCGNEPANCQTLTHRLCTSPIRNTAFSRDGRILVSVCDDGSVWRWDRTDKHQ